MNFYITLDSIDHSYSIEKIIDNAAEITVPFITDAIEECINNDYDFGEEEYESLHQYPVIPKGYYHDKGKLWDDFYDSAINALSSIVSPFEVMYYLDGKMFEPGFELDVNEVIRSVIAWHLEERSIDCQSNIDVGMYILNSLEMFYNEGQWNEGFLRDDGTVITQKEKWPKYYTNNDGQALWKDEFHFFKPVIWFGLKDELPIQCWTLGGLLNQDECYAKFEWSEDSWKDIWFDSYERWSILLEHDDSIYTWLFFECGEPEPDIDLIIKKCPIELLESDTTEELYAKIERYFIALVYGTDPSKSKTQQLSLF